MRYCHWRVCINFIAEARQWNYVNIRLLLQIHISLLSNSSGCAYGLTFDDETIPFRPQGNSTLVTWREHDLEKRTQQSRWRNLKRDGINCSRTEMRAFLLWQNVNRAALLWCDDRSCENCLASYWICVYACMHVFMFDI